MGKLLFVAAIVFICYRISENPERAWDKIDQANQVADEWVYEAERKLDGIQEFIEGRPSGPTNSGVTYHVVLIENGHYRRVGMAVGRNACYSLAARNSRGSDFRYDCCTYFDGYRCNSN